MNTDQSTAGAQSKLKTNNKTCLNLSLKHVKTNIICLLLTNHNMFSSKTNI